MTSRTSTPPSRTRRAASRSSPSSSCDGGGGPENADGAGLQGWEAGAGAPGQVSGRGSALAPERLPLLLVAGDDREFARGGDEVVLGDQHERQLRFSVDGDRLPGERPRERVDPDPGRLDVAEGHSRLRLAGRDVLVVLGVAD